MLIKNQFYTCIPLVSTDEASLLKEIERACESRPDYLEWRRDYFSGDDKAADSRILGALKEAGTGVVYTFRDIKEGGARQAEDALRLDFIVNCIENNGANYVDIELDSAPDFIKKVRTATAQSDCGLILSHHNFEYTYALEEIIAVFERMEKMGADVLKLALYAPDQEALRRITAASGMYSQRTEKAMIIIAMGPVGKTSRIAPDCFGGGLSYAVGSKSTAPGQVCVEEIRALRATLGV